MNHILLYTWGNCYENSLLNNLIAMGVEVDTICGQVADYDQDANIEAVFLNYFNTCVHHGIRCVAVFSVDYFPLLSEICMKTKILYLSWAVDNPMTSMYSKKITNSCNRIFTFDRVQCNIMNALGQDKCYHMPLATDILQWQAIEITEQDKQEYGCDISLVANLYNDGVTNKYKNIGTFPPYIKGYLDGIIQAQLKLYGCDLVGTMLNDSIIEELKKYLKLDMGPLYEDIYKVLVSDMLNRQVSMLERMGILDSVGQKFNITLYTSSDKSTITAPGVIKKGFVDYLTVMPKIFRLSKINLNVTSKSIQSGISLRVIDILGCGGFVISNYQPELAEYFINGEEIVMYESLEDLNDKISYYLTHEEERKRIAEAGYRKVLREFSFQKKIPEIMKKAEISGITLH